CSASFCVARFKQHFATRLGPPIPLHTIPRTVRAGTVLRTSFTYLPVFKGALVRNAKFELPCYRLFDRFKDNGASGDCGSRKRLGRTFPLTLSAGVMAPSTRLKTAATQGRHRRASLSNAKTNLCANRQQTGNS
ncbi:unnamed protein product, partial [Ixodes persulcatus]